MKNIFCEANGQLSSIRVMSFISLLVAIVLTVSPFVGFIVKGSYNVIDFNALIIWIVAAFCPKVIQKFAEGKLAKIDAPK